MNGTLVRIARALEVVAQRRSALAIEEFVVTPQRRVIELRDLASSRTTSRAEKWAKRFGRTRR